jgi:hypothetical protein
MRLPGRPVTKVSDWHAGAVMPRRWPPDGHLYVPAAHTPMFQDMSPAEQRMSNVM